jgi:hypothetical protein
MPTTLQLGSGLPMLPSKLDANPSSIWHCEPLRCPLPSSSLCLGSRQQYAIPSADPRISHLGRHASLAVPPLLLHLPRNGQHSGSSELKMGFGKSASAPLSSHQYMSVSNPDNPELVLDTNISRRSHAHQQVERLQGPHEGHPSSAKLDGDSDNEIVASGSIYGLVECTTVLGDDREGVVVPTSSSSGVLLRPQVQTSLSPTNQKRDDADPCRDQDLSQGKYGHRTHELMKDVTDDVRAVEPTHAAAHMTMPRDNLGVIDVDALSDVQVEVVDIDTQVAPVDMDNPIGASSLRGCPLLKKSSSEVSPTSPVCSTLAPQRPLLMRRASPSQAQPPQPMPSAQRQVSLSYSSLEQSKSSPRPQVSQPSRSPLSRRDMSPLHQAISPSTSKAQQIISPQARASFSHSSLLPAQIAVSSPYASLQPSSTLAPCPAAMPPLPPTSTPLPMFPKPAAAHYGAKFRSLSSFNGDATGQGTTGTGSQGPSGMSSVAVTPSLAEEGAELATELCSYEPVLAIPKSNPARDRSQTLGSMESSVALVASEYILRPETLVKMGTDPPAVETAVETADTLCPADTARGSEILQRDVSLSAVEARTGNESSGDVLYNDYGPANFPSERDSRPVLSSLCLGSSKPLEFETLRPSSLATALDSSIVSSALEKKRPRLNCGGPLSTQRRTDKRLRISECIGQATQGRSIATPCKPPSQYGVCSHCASFAVLLQSAENGLKSCSSYCLESAKQRSATSRVEINLASIWKAHFERQYAARLEQAIFCPRPFTFVGRVELSKFSPLTANASSLTRCRSDAVCAVCGVGRRGGNSVRPCSRCPLAFHDACMTPSKQIVGIERKWTCTACSREVTKEPLGIPLPTNSLARSSVGAIKSLIATAKEGNAIDFTLHPSLFYTFVTEYGSDWLRCRKCHHLRMVAPGFMMEKDSVSFHCGRAFWLSANQAVCGGESASESIVAARIKGHIACRSRRRSHLLWYHMGEDNRVLFGWPKFDDDGVLRTEMHQVGDESIVQGKLEDPFGPSVPIPTGNGAAWIAMDPRCDKLLQPPESKLRRTQTHSLTQAQMQAQVLAKMDVLGQTHEKKERQSQTQGTPQTALQLWPLSPKQSLHEESQHLLKLLPLPEPSISPQTPLAPKLPLAPLSPMQPQALLALSPRVQAQQLHLPSHLHQQRLQRQTSTIVGLCRSSEDKVMMLNTVVNLGFVDETIINDAVRAASIEEWLINLATNAAPDSLDVLAARLFCAGYKRMYDLGSIDGLRRWQCRLTDFADTRMGKDLLGPLPPDNPAPNWTRRHDVAHVIMGMANPFQAAVESWLLRKVYDTGDLGAYENVSIFAEFYEQAVTKGDESLISKWRTRLERLAP